MAVNKFLGYVREAKRLYNTGKYKTFAQAVKAASRQTGSSSAKYDKKRKAKPPGKRKSKRGKIYYERRKNRSDKPKTLTGIALVKRKLSNALLDYELAKTVRATDEARKRKMKYRRELKKLQSNR